MIDETIELSLYAPNWPVHYARERQRLLLILDEPAIDIEHIGSTAVEGMTAKPIIDILIGVPSLRVDRLPQAALTTAGYQFLGEAGVSGRWAWRKRRSVNYNLAFVELDSPLFRNNLFVRDYLRLHPAERADYVSQKQQAWAQGFTTLLAYSEHKSEFVQALVERARTYFAARLRSELEKNQAR